MLGIDLVDQLIAYYRPEFRCQQTLMSLFLHGVDIIQVISYVLYKETAWLHPTVNNGDINSHKQFFIEFITSLIHCSKNEDTKHSMTRQEN